MPVVTTDSGILNNNETEEQRKERLRRELLAQQDPQQQTQGPNQGGFTLYNGTQQPQPTTVQTTDENPQDGTQDGTQDGRDPIYDPEDPKTGDTGAGDSELPEPPSGTEALSQFLFGKEGRLDISTKDLLTSEQQQLLSQLIRNGPLYADVGDVQVGDVQGINTGAIPQVGTNQIQGQANIDRQAQTNALATNQIQAAQVAQPGAINATEATSGQVSAQDIKAFTQGLAESESQKILSQVAEDAKTNLVGATPEERQAYFETNVEKPLIKEAQDALKQVSRQYSASGFFSSDRQSADEAVQKEFVDALAREKAKFVQETAQQNVENQQAGLQTRLGAGQALVQQEANVGNLALGAETASLSAETQVLLNNQNQQLEAQKVNLSAQLETAIKNADYQQASAIQNELNNITAQQTNIQSQLAVNSANQQASQREAELDTQVAISNQGAAQTAQQANQQAYLDAVTANMNTNMQLALKQGDIDLARSLAQTQADLQAFEQYQALLGVQAFENIAAAYQPTNGAAGGIVGGVISAFSDRRLKKNIQKVGKASNGLNIYKWTWNDKAADKGLVGGSQGYMADEVAERFPAAVSTIDGYQVIDYEKI